MTNIEKKNQLHKQRIVSLCSFRRYTSGFIHVLKISFFVKNRPFHGINTAEI